MPFALQAIESEEDCIQQCNQVNTYTFGFELWTVCSYLPGAQYIAMIREDGTVGAIDELDDEKDDAWFCLLSWNNCCLYCQFVMYWLLHLGDSIQRCLDVVSEDSVTIQTLTRHIGMHWEEKIWSGVMKLKDNKGSQSTLSQLERWGDGLILRSGVEEGGLCVELGPPSGVDALMSVELDLMLS